MKSLLSALTVGVLALAAFAPPGQAASLTITETMSNSGPTDDWFELTNISTQTISLTGYRVDDSSFSLSVSVTLNSVLTLAPGQSAVFIESAAGANVEVFRAYWALPSTALIGYYSGSGVGLAAAGDGLVVFDSAGTEVPPARRSAQPRRGRVFTSTARAARWWASVPPASPGYTPRRPPTTARRRTRMSVRRSSVTWCLSHLLR